MSQQYLAILRDLDRRCEEANSLWRSLENHKLILAAKFGLTQDDLQRNGIHVERAESEEQ